MASYWIIVPRGNEELLDLLSVAFRGRSDFRVIEDRRSGHVGPADEERRSNAAPLGPDEIVIAERADTAKPPEGRTPRRVTRPPRYRRSGAGEIRSGEPLAPVRAQRLVTL